MRIKRQLSLLLLLINGLSVATVVQASSADRSWSVASPDGKVVMTVQQQESQLSYNITYDGAMAVEPSALGLVMDQKIQIGQNARFISVSAAKEIKETYTLKAGKQLKTVNHCHERLISFKDKSGLDFNIIVRAYNDGAAFRYGFPTRMTGQHTIHEEKTEFAIPTNGKAWIYPYQINDRQRTSYEEYAMCEIPVRSAAEEKKGWSFPMLFQTNNLWVFVTEAVIDGTYPATHIDNSGNQGAYKIRFPEKEEAVYPNDPSEPISTFPWYSPWRSITVGKELATIFNTQMVTHLNAPSLLKDDSWVKPGRSSWSWWSEKKIKSYNRQVEYVNLSKEMGWEYVLIDAGWPNMKDGGSAEDVVKYATKQGVGVWLWYSSFAGEENSEKIDRRLMTDPKLRKEEMKRISSWGVKGIKVDFFDTDKQRAMQLYIDILNDAMESHLMVDFHGSTLPRGFERTYPHMMTMEAVKGAEGMGQQPRCDAAPSHHVALVFMRNVVGSMDYTPVIFSAKSANAIPRTTYAHQLALSVVFESGLQCFADNEKVYRALPEEPKAYLAKVPCAWDESRLVGGYPADYAIILRRSGKKWYIGAINGKEEQRTLRFTLPDEFKGKKLTFIGDGVDKTSFAAQKTISVGGEIAIEVLPSGGFAGVIE